MIWTLPSFLGQLFDATVGQVVSVLGGGSRPAGRSPAPWDSGPRDAAGSSTGPPPSAVQPWQPARPVEAVEAEIPEGEAPPAKNLWSDDIKLVSYAVVSLRRDRERLLGGGQILVTIPMTPETFSTWIIACYLQAEDIPEDRRAAVARERRNAIPYQEKPYLRVAYEVLSRWPTEPDDCCDDNREIKALHGIREAILEAAGARPAAASEPAAARVAAPETLRPAVEILPVERLIATPEPAAPEPAPAVEVPLLPPASPRQPRKKPQTQVSAPLPEKPPPENPLPGGRQPSKSQKRPR
jgi:hypothetical protein